MVANPIAELNPVLNVGEFMFKTPFGVSILQVSTQSAMGSDPSACRECLGLVSDDKKHVDHHFTFD